MLYQKHLYLNKNIHFLVSNEIIEYDIKSAGFNIIKKYKLLSDDKIRYLETLEKKQRQIQIGLYQREDKELIHKLNDKFIEVRKMFFEANELKDEDILSIKRDAIVTLKRCKHTEFDNIVFVEKNIYSSYYYLNNYEFYYNNDKVDVKGISDEMLKLHREYFLDFLYNFFKMNEISSRKKTIELINDFAYYYKEKKLHIGYYRELNSQSLFRIKEKLFGEQIGVKNISIIDMVDISYNYLNYVLPLVSILV